MLITSILSGQSSDGPAGKDIIVWSATDVLCDTRARQLGATVSSPIASFDVHFRKSSMAAG